MIALGVPSTVVALGAVGLIAAIMRWARRDGPGDERPSVARAEAYAVHVLGFGVPELVVLLAAIGLVIWLVART